MIKDILKGKGNISTPCTPAVIGMTATIVADLVGTAETMYGCLGLAANQIGYKDRVIAVKIKQDFQPMVNPVITPKNTGGMLTRQERCLSLPGVRVDKRRHKAVWVTYYDPYRQIMVEKRLFKNKLARTIQHEVDHLEGVSI